MGATVQSHVAEKIGFVHVPVFRTERANSDVDLIFHPVGQVVVGAVAGGGLGPYIPVLVCPGDPAVDEAHVHVMALGVGDLDKLEAAGGASLSFLLSTNRNLAIYSPSPVDLPVDGPTVANPEAVVDVQDLCRGELE